MPAIKAEKIYKVFGRRAKEAVHRLEDGASRDDVKKKLGATAAVIDASLTVEEGEIFVVMGLSGSGKSTLIRMVNGLLEPTAGSVEVYGENITTMSAKQLRAVRRSRISMVFQHFALFPHRTVAENAAYGLETQGIPKAQRRERALEALELTGLGGWADHLPAQLSGGMRQRVGLGRALAADTDILLMDEAFSALDPLIRREMQDQLIELQSRLGKTILFITHDLNEAMRLGDRIAMMRDGRIVQVGSAEEILTDPANDYVAQFVADVDRARVLTAGSVMERPVAVLGTEQGPRAAHKLMREHQQPGLYVVGRDRTLRGLVRENRVVHGIDAQHGRLDALLEPAEPVTTSTPLAELLTSAAETPLPLAVVDEQQRLVGVLPRVTLLSALGMGREANGTEGADEADDTAPRSTVDGSADTDEQGGQLVH